MKQQLICLIILSLFSQIRSDWSTTALNYFKNGDDWYGLDTVKNYACDKGIYQSPIDINTSLVIHSSVSPKIEIFYKNKINNSIEWVHHHALQVNDDQLGYISYQEFENYPGIVYKPLQFHFHSPTEHIVDNIQYDLEMHIVHFVNNTADTQNGISMFDNYVVLGFMFSAKNNIENKFIKGLGLQTGTKPSKIDGIDVKLKDFISEQQKEFYHYKGSLTTPPCTEGINWVLFKQVQDISVEQLSQMTQYFKAQRLMEEAGNSAYASATWAGGIGNNRKHQPLNKRLVVHSKVIDRSTGIEEEVGLSDAAIVFLILTILFALAAVVFIHRSIAMSKEVKMMKQQLSNENQDTNANGIVSDRKDQQIQF